MLLKKRKNFHEYPPGPGSIKSLKSRHEITVTPGNSNSSVSAATSHSSAISHSFRKDSTYGLSRGGPIEATNLLVNYINTCSSRRIDLRYFYFEDINSAVFHRTHMMIINFLSKGISKRS